MGEGGRRRKAYDMIPYHIVCVGRGWVGRCVHVWV